MKILFGIQGTGNGHISRAREIVPLLQQYGEVDLLVSGTEAEVSLSQPLKYKFHGFSFVFGKNGGVDNWATFKIMDLRQLWKDMHSLPLNDYDLIINDFEPVSAWACRLQKVPSVSLSHQCSFVSDKTPRPKNGTMPSGCSNTIPLPPTISVFTLSGMTILSIPRLYVVISAKWKHQIKVTMPFTCLLIAIKPW